MSDIIYKDDMDDTFRVEAVDAETGYSLVVVGADRPKTPSRASKLIVRVRLHPARPDDLPPPDPEKDPGPFPDDDLA